MRIRRPQNLDPNFHEKLRKLIISFKKFRASNDASKDVTDDKYDVENPYLSNKKIPSVFQDKWKNSYQNIDH